MHYFSFEYRMEGGLSIFSSPEDTENWIAVDKIVPLSNPENVFLSAVEVFAHSL